MTKNEAIKLENKCDGLMSEFLDVKCNVSMSLSGKLKINFETNYFILNNDFTDAAYLNFNGSYSDLISYIYKACMCVLENRELFEKLIWSYDNISELQQ